MPFDEFGSQPIAQSTSSKQFDEFGSVPIPKAPDTSGVQKMAQENLSANDNKDAGGEPKPPQTPAERLNTIVGMPVNNLLNPDDTTPIPPTARKTLTKAYADGSATNAGDFWQTALRVLTPDKENGFLANIGKTETNAIQSVGDEFMDSINESIQPPHPWGANKYDVAQPNPIAQIGKDFGVPATLGSTLISPVLSIGGAGAQEVYKQSLEPEERATMPQEEFEKGMNVSSAVGQAIAGLGLALEPLAHPPAALIETVAKRMDKEPAAVTRSDIDQVISQGTNHKAPTANDFKAVETVTNGALPEKTLHIVFNETGVKPDQVFADAQRDPQVAADVAAGKVPEQYEHLVEEKPVLPPAQAEKLTISRDEATRSFTVVDKDGDHVQGGFDSHEEALHYIEDEKFKAEERAAIEAEGKKQPETGQKPKEPLESPKEVTNERVPVPVSATGEVGAIPAGSEVHPAENATSSVANQSRSKAPSGPQLSKKAIHPSEIGKPTSLYTFLRNNGGIKDEGGNLAAMGEKSLIRKNGMAWDDATELAQQHGYFSERPSIPELQDKLLDTNGGRDHYRDQDVDRQIKAKENVITRRESDPVYIEDYADKLGLDTARKPDETERQFINRLKDAIKEFYKNTEGSGITLRDAIGRTITAAEKFVGKLTGGLFQKLGDGYIRTFQPELMGDKALRADAYLAKFKTTLQEAENSYYRQSAESKAAFDKLTPNERLQWLYDHETGRWDEELDPDHARYQALYDAMHGAEQKAIGSETAYKENYLPHQWEKPEEVAAHFRSEALIKKYGADWFKKASEFKLIQEGIRAGFKLKTDNPESMLVARQLASHSMIATMDLLKDMESSGIAKKATAFNIDKKISKTETAITELQEKYKKEFEKKNNPNQPALIEGLPAAESKVMKVVEDRLSDLKERLDNFKKEKADNKLTPEQIKELKGGFRVIGPDSKVWNIDQQVGPVWKNAMEMKGLWENQGVLGDAYRGYIQAKAIWTQVKLGLSLFHPVHVAMINLASGIASTAEHLIQGGKLSDIALKDTGITMGLTKETLKLQDHPAVQAWNTAAEARTPEQHAIVNKMLEGGFKPTMSARDTVHFKENFDKAIAGVGLNNLRLIGTAISLPGTLMKPFFEHWIPGMKSEMYLRRCDDAVARDPSLAQDSGRRGEVFRQIAKDTDRTYGEMNNDVQFWNRNIRDSFNAAFISGGWKLAQIYNAKGLLEPGKIAYKFAKTGEFDKADITHNMLQAYTYTALTLALGGAINAALGNPVGTAKDTVWDMVKNLVAPRTGEKNPDGTPIRLNQPAFAKEAYNIAHEINTKGLMAGTGSFLYHQTLIPGIVDTLNNRDFTGRELISDPTDLHQWMNAGWDTISPISVQGYEKAEAKHSEIGKVAGELGFPLAGAYLNQTPFEQKVIAKYDEQNPPKGDAYQAKLKADLKSEVGKGDIEAAEKTRQRMKEEGMSSEQISRAEHTYTKPFAEDAWKKLPADDQRRLIESATDEEKKKFKLKPN